ncbi:hypothetical protein [Candidatus Uabimicrobium sp. HlEnr_7]|uniref:hypothetical protein n=1 Tax=Candidatus Uabimicrobium helgolandensis TaxID=3095367 RepID=UPI003557B425
MWKWFLVFILFCSCTDKTQVTHEESNEDFLYQARICYSKKEFQKSASLFTKAQKREQKSEVLEAQLGEILCLIALNSNFKAKINTWHIERLYYWQGHSLDPLDEIPTSYQEYFRQLQIEDYKLYHILDLLLETGQDQSVQNFLQSFPQARLKNFIVAKAWFALQSNLYDEAHRLFNMVNANKDLTIKSGILLTNILLKKPVSSSDLKSIKDKKQFYIANKQVPINDDEKSIISNMIFHLGVVAKLSIPIWEQGKAFVSRNKKNIQEEAHNDYLQLFSLAVAWKLITKGNLSSAKQSFQKIINNKKKLSRFYEAHLGLAIILWMEEEDYEELHPHFTWLKGNNYWLGGRSISILLKERRPKQMWQKLLQEHSEHKAYLVVLDTLCRLGEGRSAHALLGTLMSDFENADLISLYEKEDKNIPKDVYAENKIWEKID